MKTVEYKTTIDIFQEALGGKWKLFILARLTDGAKRPSELRQELPGISQRILTKELKELVADGLAAREAFPEVPPRVEYRLTPYGEAALPLLHAICQWGEHHLRRKLAMAEQPVMIRKDVNSLTMDGQYVIKRSTRIDWQ